MANLRIMAILAAMVMAAWTATAVADVATVAFSTDPAATAGPVKAERGRIEVDLSSLPKDTQVYRAVLRPAGNIAGEVRRGVKEPPPVKVTVAGQDEPLPLLPPRCVGFDCTAAVKQAVAAGAGKIEFKIVSLPGYRGEGACLEVTANVKPRAALASAKGVTARHRAGQTLVTWTDPEPPLKEKVKLADIRAAEAARAKPASRPASGSAPAAVASPPAAPPAPASADDELFAAEYKALSAKLAAAPRQVSFRIYRHAEPITPGNAGQAQLVDEVGPLTAWDIEHMGHYPADDWKVTRFVVEDEKPALGPDGGVCAVNPKQAGKAWYAVSRAVNGEEDFSAIASACTAQAVDEAVGQGEPVLQFVKKPGQYDHYFYVKDATLYVYTRWEAPPNANLPSSPHDYIVGVPAKPGEPAPVALKLHGWGGNMWGGGFWDNHARGSLLVATNQQPYDWWTGYHECSGTWRSWAEGRVHDYSQTRLMSFLDWVGTKWKTDPARLTVAGGSMGGSGTTNLALRRADRIAWAGGAVGVHVPAKSPQFTSSYIGSYGPVEWKLPYKDGKAAAFDYFSNVWHLDSHPNMSTPLVCFSNGKNDGQIGWPQALEFFQALQRARQPHVFYWGLGGHGQGFKFPGEKGKDFDVRADRTLPAFTRCSLDDNTGTAKQVPDEEYKKMKEEAAEYKKQTGKEKLVDKYDGDQAGQANGHLWWAAADDKITDQPDGWGMTLMLASTAPKDDCTVDVTPRRCQKFAAKPGQVFEWTNTQQPAAGDESKLVAKGQATADKNGIVTVEKVVVTKAGNRLEIKAK